MARYQANITRVFTYMVAREESNRLSMIDARRASRDLASPEPGEKIEARQIRPYHVGLFADFVNKPIRFRTATGRCSTIRSSCSAAT
jgi:hypothetical protein